MAKKIEGIGQRIVTYLEANPNLQFSILDISVYMGVGIYAIRAELKELVTQSLINKKVGSQGFNCYSAIYVALPTAAKYTPEFKPLEKYDIKSHMRECEAARSLKNGGLI